MIVRAASLAQSLLESLSHCARSVVLVIAGREGKAYRRTKADIRGTVWLLSWIVRLGPVFWSVRRDATRGAVAQAVCIPVSGRNSSRGSLTVLVWSSYTVGNAPSWVVIK
jgi:hypothetical protein